MFHLVLPAHYRRGHSAAEVIAVELGQGPQGRRVQYASVSSGLSVVSSASTAAAAFAASDHGGRATRSFSGRGR